MHLIWGVIMVINDADIYFVIRLNARLVCHLHIDCVVIFVPHYMDFANQLIDSISNYIASAQLVIIENELTL